MCLAPINLISFLLQLPGTPKIVKPEKPIDSEKPLANKVSSKFGGTREKCVGCKNTVYPTERVNTINFCYNSMPYLLH
ncbi:LIM domain-containing protein WLIM1 [Camellia lanceoleosa]|uniref:LIM domain-containing protein WLIM1 n=1 Tax=Camellia lanceoleosa TaxID=1840588 RepID=A0ACC0HK72_9ERIC|nr:LIM domain-containing protein WLIM1 [Camellia lanceoleosa]